MKDIPVNVNRNIDILFVVDDSPSMLDKQENLKANFPNFINVLDTIVGGRPDLHIGVISTDLGARGSQDASPGSGIPGCVGSGEQGNLLKGMAGTELQGTFISDIRDLNGTTRNTNYTGSLTTVFQAMASLGAGGCGFEQPLEAMKRALQNPTNASFLRDDAYLAVIFITDEDDCSFLKGSDIYANDNGTTGIRQSFRCTRFGVLCDEGGATTGDMNEVGTKGQCHPNDNSQLLTKVGDYVTFLKSLKPGDADNKIIVAGVMGTTEPFQVQLRPPPMSTTAIPALAHSCTYQGVPNSENPLGTQVADPPIRLKFFLDQFPGRSTFTTICQQNLSGGLQQIAQLLKTVIGDPCIQGKLADVDPDTSGDQYDCSVSWVSENADERILPACNDGNSNAPCWEIVTDSENCPGGDNFKLAIDRGGLTPPEETHEVAYCVTEAVPADEEDDDDN